MPRLHPYLAERTAELETANKELEAFSYSASHDLRAPSRAIMGFSQTLQQEGAEQLDQNAQGLLKRINAGAEKMAQLIDDLLSFSRMGCHEFSKKRVDLVRLVQGVIEELGQETTGRSIRWQIGELHVATGDRAMLRMALVNLVSNALKFTRIRAQAEIEIGCQPGEEGETVIYVRDNGVGFDMTHADKLFGVFQRLHSANEFEGTGIGLANVRRIIGRQGGRTWAEAEPDRGATIYFSLPQTTGEK